MRSMIETAYLQVIEKSKLSSQIKKSIKVINLLFKIVTSLEFLLDRVVNAVLLLPAARKLKD